jgi:lysophospholipase L1-like esterase
MGVVIESSEPGVVIDTLGLNGARVATALAYDEAAWVKEVARRSPDLVIMAYGSNESSDGRIRTDRHAAQVEQLIARVRAAAPAAECLVFGPIDRGGKDYEEAVAQLNGAQRLAASKAGCAYWSGQVAMGGKGAMTKWEAEDPPLAQADLLHLTSKGYERLGSMLARDLLQVLDAHFPASSP